MDCHTFILFLNILGRVQRSLIFHPTFRASCSQDVLARRSFLLARKLLMFKEKFPRKLLIALWASEG